MAYPNTAPMVQALRNMQGKQGNAVVVHFATPKGIFGVRVTQAELLNNSDEALDILLQARMESAEREVVGAANV